MIPRWRSIFPMYIACTIGYICHVQIGIFYTLRATVHHLLPMIQKKKNKRPKGPHIVHLSTMFNLLRNQLGRQFLFTDRHEKYKLDRGRWDLASCQVSLKSVQRFQRRSLKYLGNRRQGGHLVFPIGTKQTNYVEDVASCFLSSLVEFHLAVSEKKLKMSQPIRGQGGHLVFLIGPKTQSWKRMLRSCFLSSFVEFCSAVSEKKPKMSQPIRGHGDHLIFQIGPIKTQTW